MELSTQVNIATSFPKIDHAQKILAMGSCFIEHMGGRLQKHGFDIQLNPFGILYHPLGILNGLSRILQNESIRAEELHLYQERWHSWSHHGSFSDLGKNSALQLMNRSFDLARESINSLDWLIITFGTTYGYQLKDGTLVANCHKYPADHFNKVLSNPKELIDQWIEFIPLLKAANPSLNILITVSPIRHKKDGLIENNRSKARCLLLAEAVINEFDYCHYFPSYEIQLDELRDYRFYEEDLVHPNNLAQDYIWEKFSAHLFDNETEKLNREIYNLRLAAAHRPFHPTSKAHQTFIKTQLEKLAALQEKNTSLPLGEIKSMLEKQRL